MINELTDEQDHLMTTISAEYEQKFLSGDDSYDVEKIVNGINYIYALSDLKEPEIVICSSPMHMAEEAKLEKGETIDSLGCGYDAGWTAFYDFFERIGITYEDTDFKTWKEFILNSGVFATVLCENVAFVCIRPCVVKTNLNDDLHCENGPAIAWRDGYEEYSLNGVWVPKELVITPAEKLNPDFLTKEKNADVKAEFIRKFGIERLIGHGKVVDSYKAATDPLYFDSEYELIDMAFLFTSFKYAPFLKMKNQTTGVFHLEGVHPDCKSIKEALDFRCGRDTGKYETIAVK